MNNKIISCLSFLIVLFLSTGVIASGEDFDVSSLDDYGHEEYLKGLLIKGFTVVHGVIYDPASGDGVEGASVVIECDHDGDVNQRNVVSFKGGKYFGVFPRSGPDKCKTGDNVTVSASKGDLFGSSAGTVSDTFIKKIDFAIVNVPLVPEFGVIVGMLTVLSAVGIFFVVRRE